MNDLINADAKKYGEWLHKFWDDMVQEQGVHGYCQATCTRASYFVGMGFFHDYGDGIYHTAEKGVIWATVPFAGKSTDDNWLALGLDIAHSLYYCRDNEFNEMKGLKIEYDDDH